MLTSKEYAELLAILLKHNGDYERRDYTQETRVLRLPLPSKV